MAKYPWQQGFHAKSSFDVSSAPPTNMPPPPPRFPPPHNIFFWSSKSSSYHEGRNGWVLLFCFIVLFVFGSPCHPQLHCRYFYYIVLYLGIVLCVLPSTVQLVKSPSVLLTDMEGSSLGVWVAHGEGRALFPDADSTRSREWVLEQGLAPVR